MAYSPPQQPYYRAQQPRPSWTSPPPAPRKKKMTTGGARRLHRSSGRALFLGLVLIGIGCTVSFRPVAEYSGPVVTLVGARPGLLHAGRAPDRPEADYLEWRELLVAAGVKVERLQRLGVHIGRHTAASILILKGVPLDVAQELLGHSDGRTTRGYVHVASEMTKKATKRMGSALFVNGTTPRTTPSPVQETPQGLARTGKNRT
ncbi:tyrosine-type recombinase/integrase [Actinoplanes sp. NPDC051851]|uniref:tyrosine-type recombinase/integrase n=1 Tax=Actinoplanes sp. NPDC051851 TaxID=3154753 RepID=UPI003448B9D2